MRFWEVQMCLCHGLLFSSTRVLVVSSIKDGPASALAAAAAAVGVPSARGVGSGAIVDVRLKPRYQVEAGITLFLGLCMVSEIQLLIVLSKMVAGQT